MNRDEIFEELETRYPYAEVTSEAKRALNTGKLMENVYVDGKLAGKGNPGKSNFRFCNDFAK